MMSDIQAAPSNIGRLVRLPYSFSLVGVCCASYLLESLYFCIMLVSLHCIFLINLICSCEVMSVCSIAALATLYCAFMFFPVHCKAATNNYFHYLWIVWSIKWYKIVKITHHLFVNPTLTYSHSLFCLINSQNPKDIKLYYYNKPKKSTYLHLGSCIFGTFGFIYFFICLKQLLKGCWLIVFS